MIISIARCFLLGLVTLVLQRHCHHSTVVVAGCCVKPPAATVVLCTMVAVSLQQKWQWLGGKNLAQLHFYCPPKTSVTRPNRKHLTEFVYVNLISQLLAVRWK